MANKIHEAFQDVLQAIEAGEALEVALEAYPQFDEELRSLIETTLDASRIAQTNELDISAQERSKTRMLQYAAQERSRGLSGLNLKFQWRFSFAALITAVIILLSSTGIWVVSAQSLPGDPFYELKRRAEALNLNLVSNKTTRYELDITFRQRRVEEVLRLLDLERIEAITFEGALIDQVSGVWNVERIMVIVHADTQRIGPFSLGDAVQVQGVTTISGAVLATEIELKRYHMKGVVGLQDEPIWVIADRSLNISNAIIEDGIGPGAMVEVEVEVDENGVHQAIFLKLVDPPVTPEPEVLQENATPMPDETEDFEIERKFEGPLESMSGSAIIVDGQMINIVPETEIDGVLSPGVHVRVEAAQDTDGFWIALEIKVKDEEIEANSSESEHEDSSEDDPEESDDPDDEPDEDEDDEDEDKSEEEDEEDESDDK
jgi:hypothetical protein